MPRPKINPEARRKDIVLTMPPELIEKAKETCKITGGSVSSLMEEALKRHIGEFHGCHSAVSVWRTFTQSEHEKIQVTGYWLRKNSNDSCVMGVDDQATKSKVIRKMCKMMQDGWVIGGIYYKKTNRAAKRGLP